MDVLRRFNLQISACRGQSYDGAANMSGDIKGLQGRISLLEPRAIFVHCYAHNLNLILKDATADHPLFRDLFSCVHTLSNMVRESPKRMANFKNLAKLNEEPGIVLKPFCATRWTVRVLSLDAVTEQIESILDFLDQFKSGQWKSEKIAPTASGLYDFFSLAPNFALLLSAQAVFEQTENFSKLLQGKSFTLFGVRQHATALVEILQVQKFRFRHFWQRALKSGLTVPAVPRIRKIPPWLREELSLPPVIKSWEQTCWFAHILFVGQIVEEIQSRFLNDGFGRLVEIESLLLKSWDAHESSNVEELVHSVCRYLRDVEPKKLIIQLGHLPVLKKVKPQGIPELADWIGNLAAETKLLLSEVIVLIEVLLVVAISEATAERSFSTMRRIKTSFRTTMTQERLNHLAVLEDHPDLLDGVDEIEIAKSFIAFSDTRFGIFGHFN